MRIVHAMTRLLRAGSEENVLLTCKGQLREGHEVILIHGSKFSPELAAKLVPDLPLVEVPNLVRPLRPLQDIKASHEMTAELKRLRPDVLHTHQSKAGIIGRFAARAAGVPCIVHGVHILPFVGTTGASRLFYLLAERAAARTTHGFIHVSQGMESGCLDNGIGRNVPHEVIPSGFDLARFAKASPPDDWAQLLDTNRNAKKPLVVLMMASLEPRKRHLELLDILPPLIDEHPETRIVFAGEGPLAGEIRSKADTLGIGHAVKLVGYRSDPERLIALSDISILSSGQEGLPRCILQSIVGGKPTIAFDLPGLDALVRNGENGLIVPMDDWDGFGQALNALMGNAEMRTSMARAAAATDMSNWDWRRMGPRTNAFYEQLLASKSTATSAAA